MAQIKTALGKIFYTPRGEYDNATTYAALDVVTFEGSSYLFLKPSTGVPPTGDNVVTMLLARRGGQGSTPEPPKFSATAEPLPAGQNPQASVSGVYPNLQITLKIPAGKRGQQGKPLIVLPNGHYGYWDEVQGKYVDSGVDAAATVDINNANVTFVEAAERTKIETGELVPTLFGKIRKWFSDLKALAFKDKVDWLYTNLR